VTNQVTKKKHSVYPNKVNIPSLYDDGDVSNAGLFSALIQEIASLRREIDTLKSNRGGMEAGQVARKIEGVAGGLQPAYQDLYAPVEQMIPSIAGVAAQATIEAELVVINKRVNKLCQSAKDQNAAINYLFNTLAPLYPHMSSQILSIDHMCD
jgi:prefoldin subunit 5